MRNHWRYLIHPIKIPCFEYLVAIFLIATVYRKVYAQPSTELQNNSYGYLANFNSSIALAIVFLLCAFFIMAVISLYIRRCVVARNRNREASDGSRNQGLDPIVIETFPVFVYSAVKDLKIGKRDLECAVCLSEFDDFETLRLLPKCHHVFHHDCIDAWLAAHVTCPVCRAKLTPDSRDKLGCDPVESNNELSTSEVGHHDEDRTVVVNLEENYRTIKETQGVEIKRAEKFSRSHSTGHSLVQAMENWERYTLRLPE